jgi:hypothetical protein
VADQHADEAPDVVPAAADAEDPLAADRRTLVIGASAMVGLILIGVVSAQLFARGGCTSVVDPAPASVVAGDPAEDVVDERLESVDGLRAVGIVEQAADAVVEVGLPVGEATGVVSLGGGLLTTGATVTSIGPDLEPVATFTTDDLVVGDGATVFDVAVANEATGQTDAFVPLVGTDLQVGTCVDTAVVGSPFAFLLGGGDGELLLLRADEDGDSPDLQLRDGVSIRWEARLELPAGPPGTLAERLSAELGPETVVAARRVGPQEEVELPALVSVSRDDGAIQLEIPGDDLAAMGGLDASEPIRWQVAAVGASSALVHGRVDPMEAPDPGTGPADGVLVLLDLATGDAISTVPGVGTLVDAAADAGDEVAGDRYVVATEPAEAGDDELTLLDGAGEVVEVGPLVDEARVTWVGGEVFVAGRDSLTRLSFDGDTPSPTILVGGRFADVTVTADGRIAALVTPREGGEAVLLVTAPTG